MEEPKSHEHHDPRVYTAHPRTPRMRRVPTPPPAPRREADEAHPEADTESNDGA